MTSTIDQSVSTITTRLLCQRDPEEIIPSKSFEEAARHWGVNQISPELRKNIREWFDRCANTALLPPRQAARKAKGYRHQQRRHTEIAKAAHHLSALLEEEQTLGGPWVSSLAYKMVPTRDGFSLPQFAMDVRAIESAALTRSQAPPKHWSPCYFAQVERLLLDRQVATPQRRGAINKQIRHATVLMLWFACENARGKPTAGWDTKEESFVTPFVRGAYCLTRHLPSALIAQPNRRQSQVMSAETIGDLARKFMRQRKRVKSKK